MRLKTLFLISLSFLIMLSSNALSSSRKIPEDALAILEIPQPEKILDFIFDPKIMEEITSLEEFKTFKSSEDFIGLQKAIKYLELQLKIDWKTGLKNLLGNGVTLALTKTGAPILIIESKDKPMLKKLNEILIFFARVKGQERSVSSSEYKNIPLWRIGPEEIHAIADHCLLVSNNEEALKAVLDLMDADAQPGIRRLPAYCAARKALGADNGLSIFVNTKALKKLPQIMEGLKKNVEPLAALFFAGLTQAFYNSNWLGVGVKGQGKNLKINAYADNPAEAPLKAASFVIPKGPEQGAFPNISVPRLIAGLSLYRDLNSFYRLKDELFPERTSSLIFFENMMGIFFSGRDLTDEVFAEIKPEFRFVVAEQEYDEKVGTPQVKLPSFAAIFELYDPEKFKEVMEEAWQKALGLINFTRGQQAMSGLIIDRIIHKEVKFTTAYFSSLGNKDKDNIPIHFNFQPTLANVKDYLILSSSENLTRDLIDALLKEDANPKKALPAVNSVLEIDAAQLASLLTKNKQNMIQQNMLEKGHTPEQAEKDIQGLMLLLKRFDGAALKIGQENNRTKAELEIKMQSP